MPSLPIKTFPHIHSNAPKQILLVPTWCPLQVVWESQSFGKRMTHRVLDYIPKNNHCDFPLQRWMMLRQKTNRVDIKTLHSSNNSQHNSTHPRCKSHLPKGRKLH